MGLREKILAKQGAAGLRREKVTLCGEAVWAWGLTAKQRATVEQARHKVDGKKGTVQLDLVNERATVVFFGLRDGDTDKAKRVFNVGDEIYLNNLPGEELDVPYEAIIRLSGMTFGAKEDAEKNCAPTPSDDDFTSSPTEGAGPASSGDSPASAPKN